MGRPKLLLPWNNTTVLGYLLQLWSELEAQQTAVVCAEFDRAVEAELRRLAWPEANRIVNPAPERGMHSSIICAASWTGWEANLTHWAIVLGDQPHLRAVTLRRLLEEIEPDQICQPSHGGRGRHPVILPREYFQALRTSPATNLKEFLIANSAAVRKIEMDDAGLDLDMDRPEDYAQALRLREDR
jgi:molybdenum cofactor cytidylyltransferase